MNKNKTIVAALLSIAALAASTLGVTAADLPDDISSGFTFSKNFYDIYGKPNITATIIGK